MRVLLLNMPFVSLGRPAIGLSILKARLAEEGIECAVRYPNLLLAERAGRDAYDLINDRLSSALFAGDWLFAQHLFGGILDVETYVATMRHHLSPVDFETVMGLRSHVGPFLRACLERFEVERYDLVGFTTTFEQNLASLALSRLVKDLWPEKTVVFGGANCEGVMGMELHSRFPWIDYVCSGEADFSFPELVKRLAARLPVRDLPGVIHRDGDASRLGAPPDRVHEMDRLPDPDYDEYFQAIAETPFADEIQPALLIESARGCWWGAKSHCTFCGLNGATMAFRAKSAERVVAELERQRDRYQVQRFLAVDNILSHDYFRTLLPMLRERRLGVTLFYEIKSNLKREQVELLRDAGVTAIQPGVESLSTHVLQVMRKGVSAIQNVQMLKWCREYGIEIAWNLLYGFPGETPDDYAETARHISAVYHLKPPGAVAAIRLDRFSPNFNQAEHFGLVEVKPFALYHHLYPLPPESVANLAYFFEYRYSDGRRPETYLEETLTNVRTWKENRGGDLVKQYGRKPELTLIDTRPGRQALHFPLNGPQREVYDYCDEVRSRASILEFARTRYGPDEPLEESVLAFLDQMENWQLMLREGNQYLSLAVSPATQARPALAAAAS